MPTTATTIVASKAARSETDSGFQTQGGMPRLFSHECGTSPVTLSSVLSGCLPLRLRANGSLDDARPGHPPVVVGDDDVTELLGFLGVVRHEHRRNARRDDHLPDQLSQLTAHRGVERRERLVEQHQRRIAGEAARQRHPLALAARERARSPVGEPLRSDPFEPRAGDRTSCPAAAGLTDGEGDVVENGAVRQQQAVLKDHSDATLLGGDVDTAGTVGDDIDR